MLERPSRQRGSDLSEFSISHVSLIQGLDHSLVQLAFSKHVVCAGQSVRSSDNKELYAGSEGNVKELQISKRQWHV